MTKTAESTRQRAVEAIRKIAKTVVEEDRRLGPAAPKARIGKTRGAAYFNANGEIATGDEVPDDAPTDSADKGSDAAAATGDGSVVKEKKYQSISDADNAQVGDTFDQFEGIDCTTGNAIQLDLTPQEGIEYVPPDGWEDADTPPVDPDYVPGYYWQYVSLGLMGSVPQDIADAYIANRDAAGAPSYHYVPLSLIQLTAASYKLSFSKYQGASVLWSSYVIFRRYSCNGSTVGYCASPVATEWPTDNTTSLILKNGKLQAHSMDPDAAAAFKTNPPAEIEICDGQGNRYSVTATDDGGALVTKRDGAGDPVSGGRSLVIDKNGTVTKKVLNSNRDWYM